jgi:hypothetical protein
MVEPKKTFSKEYMDASGGHQHGGNKTDRQSDQSGEINSDHPISYNEQQHLERGNGFRKRPIG